MLKHDKHFGVVGPVGPVGLVKTRIRGRFRIHVSYCCSIPRRRLSSELSSIADILVNYMNVRHCYSDLTGAFDWVSLS
jgi:hypothetical protein